MKSTHPKRAAWRPGGFTLVELLVVITIIAILASVVLGAMFSARRLACESKTKSMITRLDQVITRRYESYQTRRVPLRTSGQNWRLDWRDIPRARLDAVRDLIRMEMPERRSDIVNDPIQFSWDPGSGGNADRAWDPRPALWRRYQERYLGNPPSGDGEYATAECLFLIVMSGPADDRALFSEDEIGDKDGDGWPEFKDGWGEPIYFLRWAPAFDASEIQARIERTGEADVDEAAMVIAAEKEHDPLDKRKLQSHAYRLFPLIYSGGADREPGLNILGEYEYDPENRDIYYTDIGAPVSGGAHLDNIHNHLKEQR